MAERALEVDCVCECARWEGEEERLVGALRAAAGAEGAGGAVALLLANDKTVAELNQRFRGKAGATNVLSFPPAPGGEPGFLGDLALAAETIEAEAQTQGKNFTNHAAHLCVHGFLHLLGYDHANQADAEIMEERERVILAKLGISDPYA